jgi:4-amino-4-deoxychorismate lyase
MIQEQKTEIFFETIRCEDEEVFNLPYHKKRVARTIGMNIDLEEYIYPPSVDLLKCRVAYTKDEIIDINYSSYTPKPIYSFKLIYDDSICYKYKSTNRKDIDTLYKQKEDCDEIIIVKDGLITDTSIANIAIYHDGIWLTPKAPLLLGTTRDRLLEGNKIKESNITVKQLLSSDKIALLNAMIGFRTLNKFYIV